MSNVAKEPMGINQYGNGIISPALYGAYTTDNVKLKMYFVPLINADDIDAMFCK